MRFKPLHCKRLQGAADARRRVRRRTFVLQVSNNKADAVPCERLLNFDHLTCQSFCFGPQKAVSAELVSFQELLMVNSIQINALCQLLIEKEVISQGGVFKTGTPALDSKQPGQPISENTHDITTKRFK
jgi:hypothetical protein